MNLQDRVYKLKVLTCLLLVLLGYGVLAVRGWQLHLSGDDRVNRIKDRQFAYTSKLSSQRGRIYDRKGRTLAVSVKVPSVFVDPHIFQRTPSQLKRLAAALNVSPEVVKRRLKQGSRRFAWAARFLSPDIENRIAKLAIPGVYVVQEWKRFYPHRELAGQVLGFVGVDGHGLEGVERIYDTILRSDQHVLTAQKDARGRAIYKRTSFLDQPAPGGDVTLTLDAVVQYILEKELNGAALEAKPESAFGLVMNPHSGEVLAMASYPFVNPNQAAKSEQRLWRNLPIHETFEPGSTFKVFTLAAALDGGAITANQVFECSQESLQIGRRTIRNTIKKAWLTPAGILKYSNNVGTARIGMALGPEKLAAALAKYGFGQRTGIEFPGETPGLFSNYKNWYPIDIANISFGQGIGVSMLQMVSGLAAIANDGQVVKPTLVRQLRLKDGAVESPGHDVSTARVARVISPTTVKLLNQWLLAVTEDSGTGFRAKISGYQVAGKTGTSQLLDETSGRYSNKDLLSSFMGFVPAGEPVLVGMIVFKRPHSQKHGGEIAAPVFSRVMSQVLNYLEIPATQEQIIPIMHVVEEPPADNAPEFEAQEGSARLIDFRGLTVREVLQHAQHHDLNVELVGAGVAYTQKPSPGTLVQERTKVVVYFSSPLVEQRT